MGKVLRLMKYEFRKMRTPLLLMAAALTGLEAGFIAGMTLEDYRMVGFCLAMLASLALVSYLYILIAGITSYERELSDRTGYLVFMTPSSSLSIVGSKLVFIALTAVCATALFGAAACFDFSWLTRGVGMDPQLYRQIQYAMRRLSEAMGPGSPLRQAAMLVAFQGGSLLIHMLLLMCCAYLAVTVSTTLLQTRKSLLKMAISFGIFVGLNALTGKISGLAAGELEVYAAGEVLRRLGLRAAVEFAFSLLFAGASAWLLDRMVSL